MHLSNFINVIWNPISRLDFQFKHSATLPKQKEHKNRKNNKYANYGQRLGVLVNFEFLNITKKICNVDIATYDSSYWLS